MERLAIRTESLTRRFGNVVALDGLSIEVPAGSIFGFLGPNGAGKTTTIRLLLGLVPPSSGRAEVLGYDTSTAAESIRSHAGALLEHTGLYERLSAEDNLDFYGRVWRMQRPERAARTRELLEQLGLWERRSDVVATWSRGMKQKLAVARALFHRPPLVFLDEPTAGLDPVAASALRDDLQALVSREGVTVFLTTHNLGEAERMCDLVGVIRAGRLLALGHPEELRARARSRRVEITLTNAGDAFTSIVAAHADVEAVQRSGNRLLIDLRDGATPADIVRALVGNGADVEEVRRGAATLEDAFLSLMEQST